MFSYFELIIVSIAAPVILTMLKYYLDRKKEKAGPKQLQEDLTKNAGFVYAVLDRISDRFQTNWVELVQFHNGGTYLGGGSSQKFSIRFEVINGDDIEPLASKFQDIPIENFYKLKKVVINEKQVQAPTIDSLPGKFKNIMKSVGVASFYAVGIERDGFVIGYVALMYAKQTELPSEDIDFINLQVSRLGEYL